MTRALRSVSSEKGRDPRDFALDRVRRLGPGARGRPRGRARRRAPSSCPPLAGPVQRRRPAVRAARVPRRPLRATSTRAADLDALERARRRDARRSRAERSGAASPSGVRTAESATAARAGRSRSSVAGRRVDAAALAALRARFEDEHERLYGVRGEPGSPVDIRALRLAALGPSARRRSSLAGRRARGERHAPRRRRLGADGALDAPGRARAASIGAEPRAGPAARRRVRHDRRRAARLDGAPRPGDGDARARARRGREPTPRARADADHAADRRRTRSQSIADEMATTIFRTAHSTVVRDGMDFSAALCDADGRDGRAGGHGPVPPRLDPDRDGARCSSTTATAFRPGDVFIMNDPFDGGDPPPGHLRRQARRSTTSALIGFAVTTAHHGDVGGRLPGSSACDNTEIFQEGLRLPWLRLYAAGEPVEDVFEMIRANVRIPRDDARRPRRAGRRVHRRRARAAGARARATGRERLARADGGPARPHRAARAAARSPRWPDGTATFTDYLDSDGIDALRRRRSRRP